MGQTDYKRYKGIFSLLAIAVFIWGVMGALDITNIPYDGYSLSPKYTVTNVQPDSPAEQAGLKVGDEVTRIDGIPIDDTIRLTVRDRPAPNTAGTVTVRRGDAEETFSITYATMPTINIVTVFGAATLTGLLFLILGLMAYLRNPTRLSAMFCVLSLMFAAAMFNNPYFQSSVTRRIAAGALAIITGILLGAILDYCLNFPRAKKIIADRAWLRITAYSITTSLGVALATISIVTPVMTPVRQQILSLATSIVFGGALLLAVIGVIHSFVKATKEERSATGLTLMLGGVIIGFGPLLISIIARLINPEMSALPGEQFYPLSFIAIPIGMAMALMKLEPAPERVKAEEGAEA
ncbi:MAG: PDZ domain-containing protein [Acidobacteriota bacterium]